MNAKHVKLIFIFSAVMTENNYKFDSPFLTHVKIIFKGLSLRN